MKLVKDSQKRVAVYPPEESLKNLVEHAAHASAPVF